VWASFDEHLAEHTKPGILSQYENLGGKGVTADITVVGFLLPPNEPHKHGDRVHQFGFGHEHEWDFEFHVLSIETIR
jgi:citrate lyase alpha subunit